jgi:hypothetical protein
MMMDDRARETSRTPRRWCALALVLATSCAGAGMRSKPTADAHVVDPDDPAGVPDAAARPDRERPAPPVDAAPPRTPDTALPPDPAPADSGAADRVAADRGAADVMAPSSAPSACPALTEGWTGYQPEKSLQFEGGDTSGGITSHPEGATISDAHCTYTNSGGIELFKMTKNPAGVRQRCEMRVKNSYRTGSQQFEGDVRVTAGDGTCVHQVFKFLMLVAYPQNGGELHQHSQTFLAGGVFGKWVHVNTVHDTAAGKVDIYIDCVKKLTISQSAPDAADGWYHKYGVYNLGGPYAQSEWRGVRFYRK